MSSASCSRLVWSRWPYLLNAAGADTELPRNEGYQGYWRHLLRAQHPSRVAQITKQQSKAEASVVAAFPKNEVQILSTQCPIPDYLAFVSWWRQQPCPLVLGQKRSSCHRFVFAKSPRKTKRKRESELSVRLRTSVGASHNPLPRTGQF